MPIKVYMTNIASSPLTIGNQRKVQHILETNKILHINIDVSDPSNNDEKQILQKTLASMNKKFILPQIFHDAHYCCDFDEFLSAVESNTLKEILKLETETTNWSV